MEHLSSGATRFSHHHRRSPPSAERFLGAFPPESSSFAAPALELSEQDIFSTPSSDSSPSPTNSSPNLQSAANRSLNRSNFGILAALNGNLTDSRPVFNHKASASASASLSSSASTSPATSASVSSRMMIPRPPPRRQVVERLRFQHQSAPVNVPVMPAAAALRRREPLNDVVSDDEEEGDEEERNGVILPPHEVVAARNSPLLACSVMEGAGRTLKGRDLRQVRNAIFRKTGFID